MDISRASNFERFMFDLLGRDAGRTAALFRHGSFTLPRDEHALVADYGFVSGRSTHADRIATIRALWGESGRLIDPHTADGLKVAREHVQPGVPMIVLETAQPAKFARTIEEAVGRAPPRPQAFDGIEQLPQRVLVLPADAAAVKSAIAERCRVAP